MDQALYSVTFESSSTEQTHELARACSAILAPGMLIGLSGQLGSGKTEFVRGLLSGFGQDAEVSSPSYVLENIYSFPKSKQNIEEIHHWDLYRLGTEASVPELFELRIHPTALAIVEWAEYSKELVNLLTMQILITSSGFVEHAEEPNSEKRTLEFRVYGNQEVFDALKSSIERSVA